MNLGLALHSSRQYTEAVKQFQSAVKLKPGLGPAWFFLGLDYQKLGEPDKAVQPLERALELQPGNHVALLELADALHALGRYDQAISRFQQLTEAQRANPKAWLGLGLTYASLSKNAADQLEKLAPRSAYRFFAPRLLAGPIRNSTGRRSTTTAKRSRSTPTFRARTRL